MGRKKKEPTDPQAERCKRGAAGQAKTTYGRNCEFKDKKTYNRKSLKRPEGEDND